MVVWSRAFSVDVASDVYVLLVMMGTKDGYEGDAFIVRWFSWLDSAPLEGPIKN